MKIQLLLLLFLLVQVCTGQTIRPSNTHGKAANNTKTTTLNCNNWLYLPSEPSFVNIGQLNITGDQLTIEANINRTSAAYNGGIFGGADIVSKHSGTFDDNYLLRSTDGSITTTDGFFDTPRICDVELNKTYHVAMVYDGTTLKFYRNGFLMSQVAASGNLYQNGWNTQIGLYALASLNENFLGYINEVRIWKVARTQLQIRTYMNSSLPSPTTQPGLVAYYTFDDLLNKQGNAVFNGTLNGAASINQTNPLCTLVIDSCAMIVTSCLQKEDFNYTIDLCNPLSITLQSSATTYDAIKWTLDDGTVIGGTTNPVHAFTSAGNHTVSMIVDNGSCADTVNKTISLDVQPANVIVTPDTILCAGNTIQLHALSSLGFCWSPVKYLDNPNAANPISATPEDITYYFTTAKQGNNLIINGDFSNGNTGFTSDYQFANPNITEGQYFVGANPNAWNAGLDACHGHTNGNDNMLLVNGASIPGINVWKQTIAVVPNTNYAFSTWVQALFTPNPAQLQFSINGNQAGTLISASLPTCTWTQFYTTWNSGNNTSADISIVNVNTAVLGNDFALDDISFAPVVIVRDSVNIKVSNPSVKAFEDTAVCPGKPVQLSAFNASASAGYLWSPAAGLSNPALPNPVAIVTTPTKYIVAATGADGCTAKDSIFISINPLPIIARTNDTTICHDKTLQLNVSGGNAYTWLPAATLSNTAIPDPVASPVANTTYYITVTNSAGCISSDSIKVLVKAAAVFSISPDATACSGTPVQLTASGGNVYLWQPADGLSNTTIADPFASPTASTLYTVRIKETTCNDSASLTAKLTVLPLPQVTAKSSNNVDCTTPAAQLTASGGVQYQWLPAAGLNNPALATPLSSPSVNTVYTVKATDANGCSNYDSVAVLVTHSGDLLVSLPNAFTPNGDGKNDCFGVSRYAGLLQHLEFSVYDRFGVRLFYSTNAYNCWDGRYNGHVQDAGGYVYVLKASTFCGEVFKKGVIMLIK